MRWLRQRSSDAPQLIGLSPLNDDDSLSLSTINISLVDHQNISSENHQPTSLIIRDQTPNHSTRKSRIGERIIFFFFLIFSPHFRRC
jgi:hypothetical protein